MKRALPYLLAGGALVLCGCKGEQSALDPHGPAASSIATLTWFLFGLMTAVFAIVIAATWIAIAGSATARRFIAQPRAIVAGGVAFPAIVLSGLLVYGLWLMRADTTPADPDVRIEVVGEQWWWRVRYQLADGRTIESANEIRLPVGRSIALTLTSPDVIHSLWIPSLAGKLDMIPGRTTRMRLKADRPGIYRGACAEYCGGSHALMALHAVVQPAEDFNVWLDTRAKPQPVQSDAESRGREIFTAAGCGGCHAIDGTNARGTIGPNLSDLGSRQSVGAGMLPMSKENVARFVLRGQHLKPGNRMPPFDIFDDGQLSDLASYLMAARTGGAE